jgi:hypothetical protein
MNVQNAVSENWFMQRLIQYGAAAHAIQQLLEAVIPQLLRVGRLLTAF